MLTEEQLNEIEAKFPGSIRCIVEGPKGPHEVVLRPCNRPEWKRYKARQNDLRYKSDSTEELITACVVYPDAMKFQALLDTPGYAAACDALSNMSEVQELLGLNVSVSAKLSSP